MVPGWRGLARFSGPLLGEQSQFQGPCHPHLGEVACGNVHPLGRSLSFIYHPTTYSILLNDLGKSHPL